MRQDLADVLDRIYDFERILTRIETGTATPKDMVACANPWPLYRS